MKKDNQESGELVFLRYAFPVLGYCGQSPVGAEEMSEFEETMRDGRHPSRERLEEIFPNAVKKLRSWETGEVRDYWLRRHNLVVKDNPLCRTYLGEVAGMLPSGDGEVYRIELGRCQAIQAKSYLSLKKEDRVSVHGFQVAEKLSDEDFNKYSRI